MRAIVELDKVEDDKDWKLRGYLPGDPSPLQWDNNNKKWVGNEVRT